MNLLKSINLEHNIDMPKKTTKWYVVQLQSALKRDNLNDFHRLVSELHDNLEDHLIKIEKEENNHANI